MQTAYLPLIALFDPLFLSGYVKVHESKVLAFIHVTAGFGIACSMFNNLKNKRAQNNSGAFKTDRV